ncbi:MAG: hypothetical protein KAW16_03885, partial [candidate division Zixibacteria bacterium]|nr:hypothetical protein [candidate division Zixibacteria bacterium]
MNLVEIRCLFPAKGGDPADKRFSAGSIGMHRSEPCGSPHRMVYTIRQVKLKHEFCPSTSLRTV